MKGVVLGCAFTAMVGMVSFNAPAQAATMSECAAQWKTMKAAKQTEGKTYREFSRTCMGKPDAAKSDAAKPDAGKGGDLAKDAGADDVSPDSGKKATAKKSKKADKADDAGKTAKPVSPAAARQKECGAEWKADKAAGKVAAGTTWPKYWSACSKRKKTERAA